MAPATNVLDHIIHLSPPGKLDEAVSHWETLGFKVIPGGEHADGLTSNALVSLADGVYIELIAFIKPASSYPPDHPRSTHWWAQKQPGWIDWACLGLEDSVDETIAEREKGKRSGVEYQKGRVGGRTRAGDGKELKWRVTFPETKHGRGSVPFFCQDLTPRELRVAQVQAQLSVVLDSRFDEASNEWDLALPQSVQAETPTPRLRLLTAAPGVTTSSIDEVGFFISRPKEQADTPKGFGKIVFVQI